MDNHPIPQDITGFKFKLIGKMTIKQFVYLAIGAVLAWLFFFIIPLPTIIQWPLTILSVSLGAIIAFIPIDGRPMDQMLINFFQAILAPTQFVYQKGSAQEPQPIIQQANIVNVVPIPNQPQATTAPTTIPTPAPAPEPVQKTPPPVVFPDEKEEVLKNTTPAPAQNPTPQASAAPPVQQAEPSQRQNDLEKMFLESQRQKEALEKQILEMQAKQKAASVEKFTPITATPIAQTQQVRKIQADSQSIAIAQGAPEAPNLITGIVKDPRGNPIQNILIEVMDEDSNPVRAFKTNSLGKFASATSLSNGKYNISFEDPGEKHKFDAIQIELVGTSIMPLEVTSVDPREELRRELFN